MVRTEKYSAADCVARCAGTTLAVIEIKCRSHSFGHFPTLSISHSKWNELLVWSLEAKAPALLVIQWQDRLGIVVVEPAEGKYEISFEGARRNRGDPNDLEPMVQVTLSSFLIIDEVQHEQRSNSSL
jgi:hypothetical protein